MITVAVVNAPKRASKHLQAWLRRRQHQLLQAVLFIGGPAAGLGDGKGHQQHRQEDEEKAQERGVGVDIAPADLANQSRSIGELS